jgi:hypothetical protein
MATEVWPLKFRVLIYIRSAVPPRRTALLQCTSVPTAARLVVTSDRNVTVVRVSGLNKATKGNDESWCWSDERFGFRFGRQRRHYPTFNSLVRLKNWQSAGTSMAGRGGLKR